MYTFEEVQMRVAGHMAAWPVRVQGLPFFRIYTGFCWFGGDMVSQVFFGQIRVKTFKIQSALC